MIQDSTANRLSRDSGFQVKYDRGHQSGRAGYRIVFGAYLGADAPAARKTLDSIRALQSATKIF